MRTRTIRNGTLAAAVCLLGMVSARPAFADALADVTISAHGTCATGGTSYVIANANTTNTVNATVKQTTVVSGNSTSTTLSVSLPPGGQQSLGCTPPPAVTQVQISWQVQSAQYK